MKLIQRLLCLSPALLLGGCIVAPYAPYPYAYQVPVYSPVLPVYVVPSASYYYGYGSYGYGGYGGRGRR